MKFSVDSGQEGAIRAMEKTDIPKPVRTFEELVAMVEGNAILEELFEDVFRHCVDYAMTVAQYNQILINKGEGDIDQALAEMEPIRTRVHNATMDSINAFSRELGKAGKDNSWVGSFGKNRAAYGKFALLLALNWIHDNHQ